MAESIKSLDSFHEGNIKTAQISLPEDNSILSADEVPSWLNENFIEKILEKHEKNSKVKSVTIKQCGGKGDSYVSTMYRINAHYYDKDHPEKEKSRSLIVKTTLAAGDLGADAFGAGNFNVQAKEMDMYQRVLPEFKRVLESIDEDGKIYPMVYDVNEEFEVIVMEDLMEKKYMMADRLIGQDMNHVKITLSKIARMHAASAVINQKNPSALKMFDMGIFTRKTSVLNIFFEAMLDALIDEVYSWEGYEYYAGKLQNLKKSLIENGVKVFDRDEGDFCVLNHGDLWTNNMLFCYHEDGTPKDSVLIDFQLSVVASPAVDLLYFLFTSTNDDLREHNIDELLQFYYYELKNLLARLDYDMKLFPTLQAFQIQMLKKYFYALTSGLLVFPVMIGQDKDANFEVLMGTDEKSTNFKRQILKDPRLKKNAKMLLPKLDAKGILDEM